MNRLAIMGEITRYSELLLNRFEVSVSFRLDREYSKK